MKTHSRCKCMARHNNKDFKTEVDIWAALHVKTNTRQPWCHALPSVQAGFLHNAQELLLVHFSVSIPVCFIDHLLHRHAKRGNGKPVWSHLWANDVSTCLKQLNIYLAIDVLYLQLFICEVLAQLFCYSLQILEWDLARLVIVEQAESFQDLLFGVLLGL